MKKINNIQRAIFSLVIISMVGMGCKKQFLDEYNPSNRTTDSYYATAVGLESLVVSCYPLLRDITQQRFLTTTGTDIFVNAGPSGPYWTPSQQNQLLSPLDQYDIRLNASSGELQTLWDLLYREMNRCNAVIGRAPLVVDMSDSLKNVRIGEAKFLRSLCLFWAVQQWGDVPMPLTETLGGSLQVTKASAKAIYTQMITDLTACISVLPLVQKDRGRATQSAAKFLLAKIYLTRGWNYNNTLGGTPADFTSALQLCDQIIATGLFPLETNWNNLFPLHNVNPTKETATLASSVATCNASKEVIFAIQYANPASYNGDQNISNANGVIGNNMHSQFGGGPSGVAQQARTSAYNRFNGVHQPTIAAYKLFDPSIDTRYNGTFNSITFATASGNLSLASNKPYPQAITLSYVAGDTTAITLPWNKPTQNVSEKGVNIPGGTKKYAVMDFKEAMVGFGYIGGNLLTPYVDLMAWGAPIFWKFWQPAVPYGDGFSTYNDPLFRSAEVYLMAAEAVVKGGTGGASSADVYYNRVLDRALGANAGKVPLRSANPANIDEPVANTVSYRATPSNINIDMILDESARELMGEGGRWYELKRTNTLITRGKKYNPWMAFGTGGTSFIADKHFLRPIPQGMLDNSNPRIEQNAGY